MNKEINSIGFKKKPSDTTVVVAMSGGVDSSTVAGMMKKELHMTNLDTLLSKVEGVHKAKEVLVVFQAIFLIYLMSFLAMLWEVALKENKAEEQT